MVANEVKCLKIPVDNFGSRKRRVKEGLSADWAATSWTMIQSGHYEALSISI
jgi:hypothetical protein